MKVRLKFAAAPFVLELAPRPRALADMRCEATPCNPCCQAGGSPVHIYAVLIDRCRWPHKMWLHRTASCPTQPRCCSATRAAAVLCGYAVNCGSCDGDSGLRRPAPMPAQLHAQRWSGWSCATETSTRGPVTSSVCLPPAQQTTRLPGNLSQLRSGNQVNDIPLSLLTSCSPSQCKPSYKTGSCEQSYAIACLLSNVAPPKHSLPSKL